MSLAAPSASRRHDLDWLRVIAFGLLIFYHLGMFYVTWGWHVKSVHASTAIEPVMVSINPWRLALLFFISGVALRFATDRAASILRFTGERLWRLGLPILFGMLVVVAPQTYFELREAGEIPAGFLAFWIRYVDLVPAFSVSTPTWNHLWYVVYLLAYILVLAPFLRPLRWAVSGARGDAVGRVLQLRLWVILLPAIPFMAIEYLLTPHHPTTHNLVDDWANHAHRFTIMVMGFALAKNPGFWRGVARAWPIALGLVAMLIPYRTYVIDAWPTLQHTPLGPLVGRSWEGLHILYAWASIITLLGAAQRFLNRPSPVLRYFTGAVFCYYLLHQTIIIMVGAPLTGRGLGPLAEAGIITAATIVGCGAGYEILRRIPYLRVAFGIRARGVRSVRRPDNAA